jgi:hypothetical protein
MFFSNSSGTTVSNFTTSNPPPPNVVNSAIMAQQTINQYMQVNNCSTRMYGRMFWLSQVKTRYNEYGRKNLANGRQPMWCKLSSASDLHAILQIEALVYGTFCIPKQVRIYDIHGLDNIQLEYWHYNAILF